MKKKKIWKYEIEKAGYSFWMAGVSLGAEGSPCGSKKKYTAY